MKKWTFLLEVTTDFLFYFIIIFLPFSSKVTGRADEVRHLAGPADQEVCRPHRRVARWRPGPELGHGSAGGPKEADLRHHQCPGGSPAHPEKVKEQHPVAVRWDLTIL